ncbi:MAG: Crp/Fnr family transcriptional regulator [Gammaproteobacteria bacterium]
MTTQQQKKRLLQVFSALGAAERESVLLFAEFLKARGGQPNTPISPPQLLPRPQEESVIAAIKRLSASFPMLDRNAMLDDTSRLMAQHVLQGRAASDIIDELEQAFWAQYERFKAQPSEPET